MIWGFPFTVPYGDHDEMISDLDAADLGAGVRVKFRSSSGIAQYYRLAVDGVAQGMPIYVSSGQEGQLVGLYQAPGAGHLVSVCPQGDYNDVDVDLSTQVRPFASGHSKYFYLEVSPALEIFSDDVGGQLSSWSMTGFARFINCSPVAWRTNWGKCTVTLSDTAGVRSVQLSMYGTTLASGDITGDGTCTVAAVSSGVSGTVAVVYTGNITGNLYVVWPYKYAIHYASTGFTGASFPRTPEAYAYDDGTNTGKYWSAVLSGAQYWVVVHSVDDSLNESTGLMSGGATITISTPPLQCTALAYTTGDASATQLTWDAGSGATGFYIYDSLSGGSGFELSTPTQTTGDSGITLTGISTGYSGYRYVILRGVAAGVDDGNGEPLVIEYSGGLVVLPRPPIVAMGRDIEISGRTLRIRLTVNLADADAIPTRVELYAWPVASGTGGVDYSTPLATGTVATGTQRIGADLIMTVSGTVASDGQWYYTMRARNSGGTYSSIAPVAGPVRLTTAQPTGPVALTVRGGA